MLCPITLFKSPHLDGFLSFACKPLPDPNRVAVIISSSDIASGSSDCEERIHLMFRSLIIDGQYNVYHVISPDGDIDRELERIPLGERKVQLLIINAKGSDRIYFERGHLTKAKIDTFTFRQLNPEPTIVLDSCNSSLLKDVFQEKLPAANILSADVFHTGAIYVCKPFPETAVYCHFCALSKWGPVKEIVQTYGLDDVDEKFEQLSSLMFSRHCRGDRVPGISEIFKTFSPEAVAFLTVKYINDNPLIFKKSYVTKLILDDALFILRNKEDCFVPFMDELRVLASLGNVLGQVLLYYANPDTVAVIPDENPLQYTAYGIKQYRVYRNLDTALECFSRSEYLYAKEYLIEIADERDHPRAHFLRYKGTGSLMHLEKAVKLEYPEAIALQEKMASDSRTSAE